MQTGKIIFDQIKTLIPQQVLWIWGASRFQSFSEEFFQDIPHLGGLLFKVRGSSHSGHIMIQLAPNDTYTVSTGKLYARKFRKIETISEVYIDMLPEILHKMIENKNVEVA